MLSAKKLKNVSSDSDCEACTTDKLLYRDIKNKFKASPVIELKSEIRLIPEHRAPPLLRQRQLKLGKKGYYPAQKKHQSLVTEQGHTISPSMNFKD